MSAIFVCSAVQSAKLTASKWSPMVAVGALRTYGRVMNESKLRPGRWSHTAYRIATATAFAVGKHEGFVRFRRCAARPTATLFDACGIKKMWVKTRASLLGLDFQYPQVLFGCWPVNPDEMVAEWQKDISRCRLEPHILRRTAWHVAIDTVVRQTLTKLLAHPTMFFSVAVETPLRKQFHLSPLVFVRVVAFDAGHLGLLETLAQSQSGDLIAGMDTVGRLVVAFESVEVVFQIVAGAKLKCLFQLRRFAGGVTLPANIHFLLSRQLAWHGDMLRLLCFRSGDMKIDMLFTGAVTAFTRDTRDQRTGCEAVGWCS